MMSEMASKEGGRTFKTMDEILANSHKSDKRIGNLCKYKCPVCGKEYESFSGVSKHARNTGHSSGKGNKALVLNCIKKSVKHDCRLCGCSILCDKSFLKSHFRVVHKLSVVEYGKKCGCVVILKEGHEFMDKFLGEKASISVQSPTQVGNLCLLACHLCKKSFGGFYHMMSHMRSAHKLKFNGEQIAHNFLQKIVTHECLLCSKFLLCESEFLQHHFASKHQIKSIADYCKLTGCKATNVMPKQQDLPPVLKVTRKFENLCQWKCCFCRQDFSCRASLTHHLKQVHGHSSKTSLGGVLTKRVEHRCHFCSRHILCNLKSLYAHYNSRHGVPGAEFFQRETRQTKRVNGNHRSMVSESTVSADDVGNLCRYGCQVCQAAFPSYQSAGYHVKKTGHMKEIDKPVVEKTITECVAHKCKICKALVLCDISYLIPHMKSRHNMSLAEYCKTYNCNARKKSPYIEENKQRKSQKLIQTTNNTFGQRLNKTTVNVKNAKDVKRIVRECRVVL